MKGRKERCGKRSKKGTGCGEVQKQKKGRARCCGGTEAKEVTGRVLCGSLFSSFSEIIVFDWTKMSTCGDHSFPKTLTASIEFL